MALTIETRRRVEKRSTIPGEKPTIAPSSDHTDGSWIDTDIYEGEYFINIPDGKIYTRVGSDIVEADQRQGIISGLGVVNGADALNFTVNGGDYSVKNRIFTHATTVDEVAVAGGDVTDPRIDLVVIDDTNIASVVAGTPAADPALPSVPADSVVLAIILVPANHVGGSSNIIPLTEEDYFDRLKVTPDWFTGGVWLKGAKILESNTFYQCLISHVGDVFATDLGNALWKEVGGSVTSSGVIGAAEDGDYTDGLFTDFVPTTPVGTAIDRFNETLLLLAPPPAPDLTDASGNKVTEVQGKLSFDTANAIGGYRAADEVGIPSPVSVDGLYAILGKRRGISPAIGGGNVIGILNDQVVADSNGSFVADSFGKAELGDLILEINGVVVDTLDLTSSTSAIDTTSGGTVSGFDVSAQVASQAPGGSDFALFQNRTGIWLVVASDLANGYNDIIIKHDTGTTIFEIDRFEVIIDDNVIATSYAGEVLDNLVMSGAKYLSGVEYHTGGVADYDVDISNAYRNTYSADADAVSHQGINCSSPVQALAVNGGDEAQAVNIVNKVVTIDGSILLLDESITLQTTTKRSVQASVQSAGQSIANILMDAKANSSTVLITNFEDELYRLPSNFDFDDFGSMVSSVWDSQNSVKASDAIAGYSDAVQVIGGKAIYPGGFASLPQDFDTTTIPNGSAFNDGGTKGTARTYSAETGVKYLYIFFEDLSTTAFSNFTIKIDGDAGITFGDLASALSASNLHLELRAPSQSGWMDAYKDFVAGQTADGDGARNLTGGAGGINTTLGLTIGTLSTVNTGFKMVARITMDDSFNKDLSKITFNFG